MKKITPRLPHRATPLSLLVLCLVASAAMAIAPRGRMQQERPYVSWQEKLQVASGPAHRGPWRMNDSEFHFVDDPTVAINDQGFIAVAWADQEKQEIFLQIYAPDGSTQFAEPVNVSQSPGIFSWLPRMVITNADEPEQIEVFLLWQDIVFSGGSHGGEIFFARSRDGGRSFSEPVNLSNTTAGAGKGRINRDLWHNGSLDLVRCPRGNLYAAWTEYEGNLWFARSTDGGRQFSDPLRIAGGEGEKPARGPSLALDPDGGILLAWAVGEDDAADIHLAHSDDAGQSFSDPRAVVETDGHSDAPKIVVDSAGRVHLVWAESPEGPMQRYHLRYARADRDDLDFADHRDIAAEHGRQFQAIHFPHLRLDAEDNLYLAWELFPTRVPRPQGLGFTLSRDGGESFAAAMIVPGSDEERHGHNGSQQGLLMSKLAVSGDGAVAIVNSTFRPGEASHIWLFRAQPAGADLPEAQGRASEGE